jgi:GT2 family glycosyltransferase
MSADFESLATDEHGRLPRLPDDAVPVVSVVIPNWNGIQHLPECISALARQTLRDFEVIVVDNCSTDTSLSWLSESFPEARAVSRADNGGFSAAVNDGIRASKSDYVYLLNNDTVADPSCLQAAVDALEETGYDFAASCMVFYDDPSVVNTAGDIYDMKELVGVQRGRLEPRDSFKSPVRVLGASAGAALYRRSLFDDVGLFDEDFFLLFEDVDMNLRCLISGKRCVYVPDSIVRHKESASIGRHPGPHMARLQLRNQYIVIAKDMPTPLLPWEALKWCWKAFRELVPLRPSKWGSIPQLFSDFEPRRQTQLEGVRMGLRKRGDVWSRRKTSRLEIIRWLFGGVGPL